MRNVLRTSLTTLLAAGATASLLVGCSPDIREIEAPASGGEAQSGAAQSGEAQSSQQSGLDEPVLDDARIQRIVGEVQAVIDRATEEDDPDILEERLTAGALAMRKGQFLRAKKTGTDLPPLQIEVNVASATASNNWPRVLLVGSSSSAEDPAEVFVFAQEDAKSDYMLQNWVRALGGNSIRGVAVEAGSKVLPPDAPGFRYTPEQALEAYVNHLNAPSDEKWQVFDDKTIAPQYREELDKLNEALAEVGEVKATAAVGDYPVTAVELATGEALVATSFTYKTVYARTVARSTLTMGGTPAAYLDDPNVLGTATVNYLLNVFFTVPPEGSDEPLRIVGGERTITSVTKDDEALPEGE